MQDGIRINDPFEAQNRRVHAFNKAVYDAVSNRGAGKEIDARPAPEPGAPIGPTQMIVNAGRNLSLPGKTVNHLLQARPIDAGRNLARFAVNTTLGLGGLFDPAADNFGLTERDTDFGVTLARWGVPEGAYLELPLVGPSTARDATGRLVDLALDPIYLALSGRDLAAAFGLRVASKAGERARFGDSVDSILHGSADSYAQVRLLWLMNRRHETGEERDDIDPYDDEGVIDPYTV
ncbi:MAG: VacJ family lipoprotein [Paracoccus sp. (in: a-proteobacteria)]|nr:VacJ family lipoprotein [Paracoccus sp. (in: a-proteobacteria)]